ncbi:MAG: DUF2344 domain-containing protein [Anaerolineae bacterium]|nr:DUF2344 domain-containing protein [Anaerolineae bacterium]
MTDQPQLQPPAQPQRLRITFGKIDSQKYVGHLDLFKTWERILRRAEIGLSYSMGFNARPKMQLATALPLGLTSACELLDIWLDQPIPLEGLAERLMAVSPPGLPIYQIVEVPLKGAALQTLLDTSVFMLTPREPIDVDNLRRRVADLLAQERIMRTRRDKPYDLRPLIRSLSVDDTGTIRAELSASEAATGRTDELVDALGLPEFTFAIHRVAIKLRPT